MKKNWLRICALLLALLVLAGCAGTGAAQPAEGTRTVAEISATPPPEAAEEPESAAEPASSKSDISEDGTYTAPEDVAEYLHVYGHLPDNFITKKEAKALGWPGGDLWEYAPGKSIGGDRFGNYEGLLPDGSYQECDVNYSGGKRGAERLIFSGDGRIYYTGDHYESFTQLYPKQ